MTIRVVAIVAARNEQRFIGGCLDHLIEQGVEVYLIDNDSTDGTVAIARGHLGRGLIGLETFPHTGTHRLRALLERKEQVFRMLEAGWVMHVDADERHVAPVWAGTLAAAFEQVEAQGYNAVNFLEFTFVPTAEAPDHDHPDFQQTMRWYYPFIPTVPFLIRAWQRQRGRMEIAWSGGHLVRFPGMKLYPESFGMRHYQYLSVPHAVRKYVERRYDPAAVAAGWHGWRANLRPEMLRLPTQAELRRYVSDAALDATAPHTTHFLADLVSTDLRDQ